MQSFAKFAISNARVTWLLLFVTFLSGMFIYTTQPRQEDPEITIRTAQVVVEMPGLAPERIEQLITRPIEQSIKTMPEVDEIVSISMTGRSIVTPELHSRYNNTDPIWSDLRNKMDDIASQLPDGASEPRVNDDYGRVSVVTIALSGDDYGMAELREVARDLQDELGTLPLVARVDLFGIQQERIWIEFDPTFLVQFGLSPSNIVGAITGQNIVLPGGTIEVDDRRVVIEPSGDFSTLDELRHIAIETQDGQVVYLDDLGEIRRGYVDPPESPVYYNGKPAIVLGVSMVSKSNVVALGKQVTALLAEEEPKLPLGMDLDVVIFQPDLVQKSVSDATVNLLQTIGVVLVVVMAFLGLRMGLIVGALVPTVIMITLIGMLIWGIELHRISIAAIIVALGLLVDNGVVIAEDIQKRMSEGASRMQAALATPGTLAVPLLTSSLTTVAAFMPLILIEGGTGEFLRSLGQVLAIALLSSWLLAISVTPALCYWFMRDPKGSKGNAEKASEGIAYRIYRRLLKLIIKGRVVFILLMVMLLIASIYAFGFVKQRTLGPSERNQFVVYVDLPSEASVSSTTIATERLAQYLRDDVLNPEVTGTLAYIGSGGPRFFLSLTPNDPQPNKAFMVVNTELPGQIFAVMDRVERFFIENMPEANGRAEVLNLGSAAQGTVELRIVGEEIVEMRRIARQVENVFLEIPGVQGLRNDWENTVFKMQVNIDQDRARRAGVTSEDVARTLSSYFDGVSITSYREGDTSIPILMRASSENRGELDRVRTIEVLSKTRGVPVPLIQIADFVGVPETSKIRRVDQQRTLSVAGVHPNMTAVELYSKMKPILDAIELRDGYTLEVRGEIHEQTEANGKLFAYAPHALFVILLLLVLQFNSFRRTAIILLTIPLVLIGAVAGMLVFKAYFDFTAMLGLFSLAGIIINNGIVLIDRVDIARSEGMGVNEAVIDAGIARARPIVMTTTTTVLGLIPLALFGGEFWYGMAIVIMSGLAVGTFLTLGFVPVLYCLLFRDAKTHA
jgi:multidrug efflux pump subunit AcrB